MDYEKSFNKKLNMVWVGIFLVLITCSFMVYFSAKRSNNVVDVLSLQIRDINDGRERGFVSSYGLTNDKLNVSCDEWKVLTPIIRLFKDKSMFINFEGGLVVKYHGPSGGVECWVYAESVDCEDYLCEKKVDDLGFTKVVDRYDFKRGDFWVFERVVSKWFFNGFYFEGDGFRGFVIDEELIEHPFKIGDVVKIGFRFKDEKCFDMKIVFLRERGVCLCSCFGSSFF